ncbi:MAG: Fe-S cluster assembly protein IscX [Anaerolineae bacterium]|nr:Fe-S cluster assembly protein IscX [Anaerolineae bacterium]
MSEGERLYWDSIFEIVLALKSKYPETNLEEVSLDDIFNWTIALPDFADDIELANHDILMSIYQEWYEESNPL